MLLHGGKNEESIRSFFQDVYELYVKVRVCHCCLLLSATLSHATNRRARLLLVTVDCLWYYCAITGKKDVAESDDAVLHGLTSFCFYFVLVCTVFNESILQIRYSNPIDRV